MSEQHSDLQELDSETAKNLIKGRSILVVDDHRNIRLSIKLTIEAEGGKVTEAETYAQALMKLGKIDRSKPLPFDAILLDIRLPDGSGLDVLKQLSFHDFAQRVIVISGEGKVKDAFEATKMGAFDYIEKPFTPERLLVSLSRCLGFNKIQLDNERLKRQISKGQEIIGDHRSVQELRDMIKRIAKTQGRVLILGESGTGKELIARAIHENSERADKKLVKVNCAAIPQNLVESELFGHEKGAFTGATKSRKGLFEQADGGSLFLDEIGELDLNVQAKLLRVLQNGEITPIGSDRTIKVDVRLIAATHRDLADMSNNGEFREDLYYRLNVVNLVAPPLRDRLSDIDLLAPYFVQLACDEHSVGERVLNDSAIAQLKSYSWPGNIRELRNVIEREVILSEHREIDRFPSLAAQLRATESQRSSSGELNSSQSSNQKANAEGPFVFESHLKPWQDFHQELGRQYLKYVLQSTSGNVSEAARLLCLERAYLHRLMKKLGIQRGVVFTD